ncbi:TrbC/VirB2 family protein [Bordetella ansorpii]|nr:TrbC/VirB2 family protein [Bordetella ansorpii]
MQPADLHRRAPSRARVFARTSLTLFALLVSMQGHAQGLTRARSFLQMIEDNVEILIPIIAIIALALLGILYAADMIRKDTLFHWFVGIVIAGSAAEFVAMMFI